MQTVCLLWCSDLALTASQDVKTGSLSCLLLPSSQPTFQCNTGGVMWGETILQIMIRCKIQGSFYNFILGRVFRYRRVFSRQGFSCVCWCSLVGGQVKGAFLMCSLFTDFTLLAALTILPSLSQLAYSRTFPAIKQGLNIIIIFWTVEMMDWKSVGTRTHSLRTHNNSHWNLCLNVLKIWVWLSLIGMF